MFGIYTSGGLRKDLRTPAVRFIPCVTPLLGPSPKSINSHYKFNQTCGDESKLVFFIPDFLFLHVSPREEKAHHSLEELIHELDGKRHHIDLIVKVYMNTKETQEVRIQFSSECY
uniref:Uncharacterized protein n=2 Tax=Astyanax mexicanus TaxID=7994 RepID=A0A8B9JU70_ASTMX